MKGAGIQPAGLTPAGTGAPDAAREPRAVLFRDPATGRSLAARRIDPKTGRYVLDERGRALGMTAAQQGVHLAVQVDLGTAAVRELGNRLKSIKTFTASFERELRAVYEDALARLIRAGLVELVSVTARRFGTSGAYVHVRWRDRSTGQIQTTEVRS